MSCGAQRAKRLAACWSAVLVQPLLLRWWPVLGGPPVTLGAAGRTFDGALSASSSHRA